MTARWLAAMAAVLLLGAPALAGSGAVKGTIMDADGTPLPNAVVLVDGPAVPPSPDTPHAAIEQRDQKFVPRVVAVPVGATVDFPNHDPMLHNVFSASPAKKFDLGMYDRGETKSVTFDAPGVVRIGCNVHPKMEAFVVVHTNPYAAVTDAHGTYTISGVPAGSWQVRVWDERLADEQVPVVVRDGQVQPLDVRLHARR